MAKVVVTARNFAGLTPDAVTMLKSAGHHVTIYPDGLSMSMQAYCEAVGDAQAVLMAVEPFTAELLSRLPALRLISRRGVGVDNIDMAYCATHGIHVARTVGVVEGAAAEHALASILYFARRLHEQNAIMHEHRWARQLTNGAKSRTVGIVGFGGIGTQLARRAAALDMRVVYTARRRHEEREAPYCAEYQPLDSLLTQSDYVVAAVPLNDETRGLFGSEAFARMKPGAVFINVARAAVADEDALYDALTSGHLGGASIDVHPSEPCLNSRFAGLANVLLTPHTATYTSENFDCMNRAAAQNVIDFFAENP